MCKQTTINGKMRIKNTAIKDSMDTDNTKNLCHRCAKKRHFRLSRFGWFRRTLWERCLIGNIEISETFQYSNFKC